MRHLKFLILVSTALFSLKSLSDDTTGGWAGVFSTTPMTSDFSLWQELQLRYNFEESFTNQTLMGFGGLWKWNEQKQLGLFYGFVKTGSRFSEHRITQQMFHHFSSNAFIRFRLEERWLEEVGGLNLRGRAQVRWQTKIANRYSLALWDEIFVHLLNPEWVQDTTWDRNRAFIGVRRHGQKHSFDFGYMNQYAVLDGEDLSEHLLMLMLFY